MEHKVTLTIEGKKVCVPEGTNVLEAARTAGIEIPTLCYLKDFLGFGACRICLVEIEGFRAPVTACTTIAKDGMKVTTNSPRLQQERKFVLDLIFSMHPPECGRCPKLGVCDLRKIASKNKVAKSSFGYTEIGHTVDDPNPFIYRDTRYCILCGKCVRICQGQGTSVLAFLGRGVKMTVSTPNNALLKDSGCTFCGSCVEVCPVNALSEKPKIGKGRESKYKRFECVCLECGNACDTIVSVYQNEVVKVNAKVKDDVHGYLCAVGRFGFTLDRGKRITAPMKRKGLDFEEITWDEAISTIAERIKGSSMLLSAKLLNEDIMTAKAFAKALQLEDIASTVELYSSYNAMKSKAEIDDTDLIIVVGLSLSQKKRLFPALDFDIRRKVRLGSKLIAVSGEDLEVSAVAEFKLIGDVRKLINELLGKESSEDNSIAGAKKLYESAKSPVIICEPSYYDEIVCAAGESTKLVAVPYESNAKGVAAVMSDVLEDGKIKAVVESSKMLYVVGEVWPNIEFKSDFIVMQKPYLDAQADKADLLLPAPTSWEMEGSIINLFGSLTKLQKALAMPEGVKTYSEVLQEIAKAVSVDMDLSKDIEAAIEIKGKYEKTDFKGILPLSERKLHMDALNELIDDTVEKFNVLETKSEVS